MTERLSRDDAKTLLGRCLEEGEVIPSRHFREELKNEGLELDDASSVLKSGQIYCEPNLTLRPENGNTVLRAGKPEGSG